MDPGGQPLLKKLPLSISCTDLDVKSSIQKKITDDIGESTDDTMPLYLHGMPRYTVQLFDFKTGDRNEADFMDCLKQELVDTQMKMDLEDNGVLNWASGLVTLYPMKTKGDGNCLLHAASLGMWAVHDSGAFLRRLMHIALVNDGLNCSPKRSSHRFRVRWRYSREHEIRGISQRIEGGFRLDSRDWDNEWTEIVRCASDIEHEPAPNQPLFDFLEDIHVFVLANILRRPIIILSNPAAHSAIGATGQTNNFLGIYLPLLWSKKRCLKSPLIIGFSACHFCPLLTCLNNDSGLLFGVPLVTKELQFLPVKFLSNDEEPRTQVLLGDYLDLAEITCNGSEVLIAKCTIDTLPLTKQMLEEYFDTLHKMYLELKTVPSPRTSNRTNNNDVVEETAMEETLINGKNDFVWVGCKEQGCHRDVVKGSYYCSVHKRRHSTEEPTIQPLSELGGTLGTPNRSATDIQFHEENCNSLQQTPTTYTSKPCIVCGCDFYGYPMWGGKCSQHKTTSSTGLHEISTPKQASEQINYITTSKQATVQSKDIATLRQGTLQGKDIYAPAEGISNSNVEILDVIPRQSSVDDSLSCTPRVSSWMPCRNGGSSSCTNSGLSHFGGRCRACYMKMLQTEQERKSPRVTKCMGKNCRRPSRPEYHGYCEDCWEKSERHPRLRRRSRLGLTNEEILALLPSTGDSVLNARDFYRCLEETCRSVSTERTLGYCTFHFADKYRQGVLNIPTVEEITKCKQRLQASKSNNTSPQMTTDETPLGKIIPKRHAEQEKPCDPVQPACMSTVGQSYKKYSEEDPRPTVQFYHQESQGRDTGLSFHSTALATSASSRLTSFESMQPISSGSDLDSFSVVSQSDSDLIESAAPSDSDTSPTRKCIYPKCDNTGLLKYNGLCDTCYVTLDKSKKRQENANSEQSHKEAAGAPIKCKKPGCEMFGTADKNHYCSKCYKDYTTRVAMENATVPELMSRLPLDATPRMCVECGQREGVPQLQNFCSECAYHRGLFDNPVINRDTSFTDICDD